jgi:peptide/nickel transport system substrate-binding protein
MEVVMAGMWVTRRAWLIVGLLSIVLLGLACAKSEKETASSAPSTPATQKPVTGPAAAPAPAATTTSANGEGAVGAGLIALAKTHPEGQPLVPGGPPFYPRKLLQEKGFQLHLKYHTTTLPLWTKAVYGGEQRFAGTWNPAQYTQVLRSLHLSRPSYSGMLLLADMGRCTMAGRTGKFDTCNGQYGHNQSITIIPGLYERWETPTPLTYVFHVRKGVLWPVSPVMKRTDREVTAQDIVWFLETTKREGVLKDNFSLVKEFVAVDRYTVRVNMLSPHAEFLRHTANTSMGIFPKECYEAKDCLGGTYSFSPGPFLISQDETVTREKVVFTKNPEFYLKGLPYLDRWRVDQITDPAAQKAAFFTRRIDQIGASSPLELDGFLKQTPDIQVHSAWVITGTVVLRPQLTGPLADVRVRRALAMTMDLPYVWEAGYGGHTASAYLVSHDTFGSEWYYTVEQLGENYQLNPQKAKQLMAEAGYPNGFDIKFTYYATSGPLNEMGLAIQANWKKYLGVNLSAKIVDFANYSESTTSKNWEGLLYQPAWNIMWWADQEMAIGHFTLGQFLNLQNVGDPVAQDLFPRARSELDPAKRTALLWQWEERERSQVYVFRVAILTSFLLYQPWEMNAAGHEVAWFTSINGPTWLGMHDTTKAPKR